VKQRHARKVSFIVFLLVICISVVLDRITKSLVQVHLANGVIQPLIPGVLDFRLVYNTGAAWGMFEGARNLFLIIAAFVIVAMFVYILANKSHAALEIIALGMVAGGAIGNGIDRFATGQVIDFIHTLFIDFPLFNIADSSITVGVILFLIMFLFGNKKPEPAKEGEEIEEVEEAREVEEAKEAEEAKMAEEAREAEELREVEEPVGEQDGNDCRLEGDT
jgi:signal peptidase II